MAVTGIDIYKLFQNAVDQPYSGYVPPAQANRWFKQSYLKVAQDIYTERLNNQLAFDEMSYLISLNTLKNVDQATNQVWHSPIPIISITNAGTTVTVVTEFLTNVATGDIITINGAIQDPLVPGNFAALINGLAQTVTFVAGSLFQFILGAVPTGAILNNTATLTVPEMFSDYMHLLYAKVTFNSPYYDVLITNSTNSLPIRITLNKRTTLRDKDLILIAGIPGNTNANGRRYFKYLNAKVGALYQDINLQTGVAGNGIQTGSGTVNQIITSSLKTWESSQKGAIYAQATATDPMIQQGKLAFQIYPTNVSCETMQADYIRKMPVEIDVANSTYDYERAYPYTFLVKIATEAGRLFAKSARDGNLDVGLTQEILENP